MVSVFHFILFSCIFSQYYDLNINQTGQSHLVVLQESINLEENWEIGIFDQSAIVNNNSCDDEYGELLVASGVWNQTQLNLAAIGSIDFCDIGGEQMAGYVESNPISVRLYDPNNSVEYSASFSTFDGFETGFVTGFMTVISEIFVQNEFNPNLANQQNITHDFDLDIYPNPANPYLNINCKILNNDQVIISIYSIKGQLIQKINHSSIYSTSKNLRINTEKYPSGNYIVKMKSQNDSKLKKFAIIK